MGTIKKNHSKQTKFQAVLMHIKNEQTMAQISQKYGVHQAVIYKWKKIFLEQGSDVFESTNKPRTGNDTHLIESLNRKIGELTMEIDFLKKISGA